MEADQKSKSYQARRVLPRAMNTTQSKWNSFLNRNIFFGDQPQGAATIDSWTIESATLRANVSCVLTCSRALRAHVLSYLACVRAHVPTCLACSRAHVPMCLACLRDHMNTCSCLSCPRVNVPCVLCEPTCSLAITTNEKYRFSTTCFLYIFVAVLCLFTVK